MTLEAAFTHIQGKQASPVNNGQSAARITLQDRDGIVLLRQNTISVPAPSANVRVQ